MSESKYTTIVTQDGTRLTVQKPMRLTVLLPDPKEAAKEWAEGGLDDRKVNDPWVRGGR